LPWLRFYSTRLWDGAFRTQETVKIEKNSNNPERDILRFGDGKDKEALRESGYSRTQTNPCLEKQGFAFCLNE
jgi:hypothetical protein